MGGIATAIQFVILASGVEWLALPGSTSSAAGYLLSSLVNYLLNRRFTFRSRRAHRDSGPRFFVVLAGTFSLNLLLMYLLADSLRVPYLLAQVLTTAVVLVTNFTAHALWTFAEPHPGEPD